MDKTMLEILERLERFRAEIENGEITGSADWIIRVCQATVANMMNGFPANRKDWMQALKHKWSNGKYVEGEIVPFADKRYCVVRVYQLTDKEMVSRQLHHRYRVTLQNVDDRSDRHDFAIAHD